MAPTKRAKAGAPGADALALFDKVFPGESWQSWRAWLCAVFGLTPHDQAARALIRQCTGRASLPTTPAREVWTIAGRRSGKSRLASLIAVHCAAFRQYPQLAAGERAMIVVLSADRRQSGIIFNYVSALLKSVPALAALVQRETADQIDLSNNVSITIQTSNFRTTRGYSVAACVLDETCFWQDDSSNSPAEVIAALRPGMSTFPDALLVALSSPHAKRGPAWQMYDKWYGRDAGDVLIWQAASRVMNPTLSEGLIARAYEDDPGIAESEYGGAWRRDLERLFGRECVEACVMPGRYELPPMPGLRYSAFVDPSGGSIDSMTLAIAHLADGRAIVDCVREVRPPLNPEATCADFAGVCKQYRCTAVRGDAYAGIWPKAEFAKSGILYEVSPQNRSELYLSVLPLLNSGRIELLDHAKLIAQFIGLDRRVGRSGKDAIDHRPGSFDDLSNAVSGALITATASTSLKQPWPAEFAACQRANEIIGFDPGSCSLLGGGVLPSGPACFQRCPGWTQARPAWRAYQQSGGEQTLRQWAREHFETNALAGRCAADYWRRNSDVLFF